MMRPDLEDYEEVSDLPELDNSRSRAMSWLVLGVAVAGFGALAYYAYHSGTQSVHSGDVLVVEADKAPLKEAPANPDGEQFANKDKTIYDVIAGDKPEKKVEKLLPDAEHPTAVKSDEKEGYEDADIATGPTPAPTTTFVNKNADAPKVADKPDVAKKDAAPAKVDAKAEAKPSAKPVEVAKLADEKPAKKEVAEQAPSADAPKMINEKPAVEKKEPAKPVEVAAVPVAEKPTKVEAAAPAKVQAKPVPKPVVKAAEPAAANGAYKIQLGAFQSEEEARGQWKKITAKFGSVIKGEPIIVLAELDKGTYYRLRAGGFASADAAKQACAALTAKSQACFPVGK